MKLSKEHLRIFERFFKLNSKAKQYKAKICEEKEIPNKEFNSMYCLYLSAQNYKKDRNNKVRCVCGQKVLKSYLKKHQMTKSHMENIAKE